MSNEPWLAYTQSTPPRPVFYTERAGLREGYVHPVKGGGGPASGTWDYVDRTYMVRVQDALPDELRAAQEISTSAGREKWHY